MPTSEQIEAATDAMMDEAYTTSLWAREGVRELAAVALSAAEGVKVRIKPLEWEYDAVDDDWTAQTPFEAPFYVERAYDSDGKDGWVSYMWQSSGYEDVLDSADEAKAAAQADYEARILSALKGE